jgi:hypothetical protein
MVGRARVSVKHLFVLALWLVAFVVFVRIHRQLSVVGNTYIQDEAGTRSLDRAAVRLDIALAAIRFLGASLAMVALLLGARRRILFALPVLMTVMLPALFGGVPDCWAFDQSAAPHGIGPGWTYTAPVAGCGYQLFATWRGVAVDLALVLIPVAVLAILAVPRRRGSTSPALHPASTILSLSISGIGLVLLMSVRERVGYGTDWFVWLAIHIPLATFGVMVGLRRTWWSLALLLVPLGLFPIQAGIPYGFDLWGAVYLIAFTLTAAAWRPIDTVLEKGRPLLAKFSRREVAVPIGS